MRRLRLSIVGFGTVGRWLAGAVHRHRSWLETDCGVDLSIVGVATRREGFLYHEDGFDISALLDRASAGRPLADYPGARRWERGLDGLAATESDILAEASNINPREPEPALSHIRQALQLGVHVITSSKGTCAADGSGCACLPARRPVPHGVDSHVGNTGAQRHPAGPRG